MGMFLNSETPALNYQEIAADPLFVDKTELLAGIGYDAKSKSHQCEVEAL